MNSAYAKNDFQNIHQSFYYKGKLQDEKKALDKMFAEYPKDTFRNYLLNNLKVPE